MSLTESIPPAGRAVAPKLTLPNELAYLSLAQLFVRNVATQFGFEEPSLGQLDVAVEEAVTNVMKYGYDAEESRSFDLTCERLPGGIRVIIHETGMPFDPSQIPEYHPGEASGMGVFLMKSLVDDCSFHNLGPLGKETHLIKYLPAKAGQEGDAAQDTAAEPAAIAGKIDYDVRLLREDEAIEISRCAYRSHGYSFFDDHIYYPDRLVEMNRSGDLISAVAVTKDNVFMGHAALLFQYPGDRIAEVTFAFVNAEFRGQGALNRLNEFLIATPKPRPFEGIYGYCVANHVISQKALARSGFHDCGLLLATSPRNWKFKGIPGEASQRISVVLCFQYMNSPQRLKLYPPAHHREMVKRLYGNLGVEHDFATPERGALKGVPEVVTSVNSAEGCAEIFVAEYGEGVIREIRRVQRSFCVQQIAAMNLFLRLQDPNTFFLTEELEKLGFYFAGILPCTRFGDALILQYLNNVDLDYSKISAYSGAAQELVAYIQKLDPVSSI